jgi:hypothetical protein
MLRDPSTLARPGQKGILSWNDILIGPEEAKIMDDIFAHHLVSILAEYGEQAHFRTMRSQLDQQLPQLHRIKLHQSKVYPLAAMPQNEPLYVEIVK